MFHRLTIMRIFIIQGSFSIVTDFICAAFPAFLFRDLKISFKTKFALCVLMSLGIITASICVVRTSMSYQVLSNDVSWVGVPAATSRILEVNLGNICACAPILKPLWRYIHVHLNGSSPDAFIFPRAPQPFLTRRFSQFRSSAPSESHRTVDDVSVSGTKKSKSTLNNSSGQSIDLPLQGTILENGEGFGKERDPPQEWPLLNLPEGGLQTRRANYEFITN